MQTTLLDRFAARIGYQRVPPPAVEAIPNTPPAVPPTPPHLVGEASFDYAKAACDRDWAFFLEDGQAFTWAIGKHGWMPVALAGFVLGGAEHDGCRLFSDAISNRLWLPPSAPSHASWSRVNWQAICGLSSFGGQESVRPRWDRNEGSLEDVLDGMVPAEISHELRTMWRRCYPLESVTFLASSDACVRLHRMSAIALARTSTRTGLDFLLTATAGWFESRGLDVDHERMLVAVAGYEPLFHRDSDPGAF